jgi:uncharacterized protein (TIGR03118 family)
MNSEKSGFAAIMRSHTFNRFPYFLLAVILASVISPRLMKAQQVYVQTNLVSDGFVAANTIDTSLVNPWGLVQGPTSPFWASDQGMNVSTLYNGLGTKLGLTVTIPTVTTPPNGPTGIVFNGGAGFDVTSTSGTSKSLFIFGDLNGNIYGWNGGAGNTTADLGVAGPGGPLTGLTLNTTNTDLYAANFTSTGSIVEYNSSWSNVTPAGSFTDPSLPAGYEPYNVDDINGTLFVAYEPISSITHRPAPGAGNGVIAEYDASGNFLKNLITGGVLNDPWGMVMAPSNFGAFSNDLLVGNFGGDTTTNLGGAINAFDPTTGAFLGTLDDISGNPITNSGLWAMTFGNGSTTQHTPSTTLYITAGLNGEKDGVLAAIDPSPEPESLILFGSGLMMLGWALYRRQHAVEN